MPPLRERAIAYIRDLKDRIVAQVQEIDGSRYQEDSWER